jgi:hypothetical protein
MLDQLRALAGGDAGGDAERFGTYLAGSGSSADRTRIARLREVAAGRG